MQQLAENLWHLQYSLKVLGADMQRHVAVMRLPSGQVVIHSSGPFKLEDMTDINALGPVGWLMDVMPRHDTFTKQGHEAFPQAAVLGPAGFSKVVGFPTGPLLPSPGGGLTSKFARWQAFPASKNTRSFTGRRGP